MVITYIILIAIACVSFYGVVFIVSKKSRALEEGQADHHGHPELLIRVQTVVALAEGYIEAGLKQAEHSLYQILSKLLGRFIPWFRLMTSALAQKLESLAKMVQGRGMIHEKGSSSLFLRDVAGYKKKTIRRRLKVTSETTES